MSDADLEHYTLKGTPAFTQMRLVPSARVATFSYSANDLGTKPIDGAPFVRSGGPMYVVYDLPLPAGAAGSTGPDAGGIGTLELGKITPLIEWPADQGTYTFTGWFGDKPVIHEPTGKLYAIAARRVIRVDDNIRYSNTALSPELSLGPGITCGVARARIGSFLEARMANGSLKRIVDSGPLDAALHGLQDRPTVREFCFRFGGHDFVDFFTNETEGAIFRIDRGELLPIGYAGLAGGDPEHILLETDVSWPRHWYNEEVAPK